MNVLSVFDGISCGQLALQRAGIKVKNYYASEIDKYAISVTMKNFPDTIQLGSVTDIHYGSGGEDIGISNNEFYWPCIIDLLIGGSPCQGFSNAGEGLNFTDERSKLFFEFARLLKEIRVHNPDVLFLLENVKMKKVWRDIISDILNVEPILINSALVSAQNRERYYWTNIKNINQPEDKNLFIGDILENDPHKKYNLTTKAIDRLIKISERAKEKKLGYKPCILSEKEKFIGLDANYHKGADGKRGLINGGPKYLKGQTRYATPLECERLQTLPDNYTGGGISNTQRYKSIGNGWTIDVISHIFSFI